MSNFRIFDVASSAMAAQSARLNTVASNLANADSATSSTGQVYRGKQVVFSAIPLGEGATGVKVERVVEDQSPMRIVHDPSHPAADKDGNVTLPNVNVVDEMVNMISASRAYQTNVDMMNTAKSLMLKALTLGQ
jgi:flagellar basal-body rod protein FlgC